ncbi:MAG: CoA-binding protein [bacterium]|nr:MAG: CoA-binding protein [bacterium]
MADSRRINSHIEEILRDYKHIAVVGVSDKPNRDSHSVAKFMIRQGYQVYPVNPKLQTVLDNKCYPDLLSIPAKVELVDIFRKPEQVEPIIEQAIEIGAKAVWMQLGIINYNAAEKALRAGLYVVMDRCWKIEYSRLGNI